MNIPVDNEPPVCTVCTDCNEAVSLCEVEREYLCAECAKQHKRAKMTSSHKLIDVLINDHNSNDVGDRSKAISARENSLLIAIASRCELCKEAYPATAYCEACKQSLCNECVNYHKKMRTTANHNVVRVNETRERFTSKLGVISQIKTEHKSSNKEKYFCLTCNKLVEHCIDGHNLVSQDTAYNAKRGELKDMIEQLTDMNADGELQATQNVVDQENESFTFMQSELQKRFRGYLKILEKREEHLKRKLDETHTQNQIILKHRVEVNTIASSAERLCRDADIESFLTAFVSHRDDIRRLRTFKRLGYPDTQQKQILTETCTIDEFQRIVETLGEFRTSTEISDNYVLLAQTSSTTRDYTLQNILTNNESPQIEHRLDALKPVYQDRHQYLPSTELSDRFKSSPVSSQVNPALSESIYERPHSQETVERFKEELTETNVPKGKMDILKHPSTRSLTQARFKTNNLACDWRIDGNEFTVYANTEYEAEICKHIVNESVSVEHIQVRQEAMLLVESDKWLCTTNLQKEKYRSQISIEVLHDKNKIAVYSTEDKILKDVCDALNKFFRENNLKVMYLKYQESTVTRLLKQPTCIKNVLCSWSQYCVDVTKHDEFTVLVKGIGIGLAQVARSMHELAVKCKRTIDDDDDRDDENGDDDIRFDDVPVGNVDVEIKLKGVEAALRSLSLVGDDRVVYVFHGDVTELPVEVIVNPADTNLKHNGGLAKILVKKGGKCIQDECREFIKQHGELNIGYVMCSGAGSLCSRRIVHAAGPKWKDGKCNEEALLEEVVANSLAEANRRMMMSIAIPCIGAGAYGFRVGLAAKCITRAIKKFFLKKPTSCIREVYLVDISVDTVPHFTEALRELYDKCDHIVSTPTSQP